MLSDKNIETIETFLGRPKNNLSIDKIKGDASDRQYYRVGYGEDKSVIIMLLPSPVESNLPYIEVQQILKRSGIAVPETYHYAPKEGLLIIEDCGDISLEQLLLGTTNQTKKENIYKRCIDIIVEIQTNIVDEEKGEAAFKLAFDEEKLIRELNFMLEHLVNGLFKQKMTDTDREETATIFGNLCKELADEPRVFTHRDYHSRNIMVKGDRLILIDFQDARMGPAQYDLVSLLRDSYSPIDDSMLNRLIDYYIEKRGGIDRKRFIRIFDLMTLQRSLKAAGTFAFQNEMKKNNSYLKYLPPVLGYAGGVIKKYEELERFKTVFERYIDSPLKSI
ncbi:MAG: phosphotransferase [Nitrospinota bacterium]|nr:phosphotransferase [Nitrospinota bacterium]